MESNHTESQDYLYCLAASPNFMQDGLLFSAKQSGLYRSRDSGQTWEDAFASLKLNSPLPSTFVTLAHSSEGMPMVFACVEGSVLRSKNGGEAWEVAELSSPAPLITSLVVSPNFAADGVVLVGTMQDGVFRSANRGATWTGWNFGLFDPNINALAISSDFIDHQTILAGTQSGIFLSRNSGRSWRDVNFPIDAAPVLSLAVHSKGAIYAGTEKTGLFTSNDGGKTWDQRLAGPVEQVICCPDGRALVLTDSNIQFSEDDGKSWQVRAEIEADVSYLLAPSGLDQDDPLWLGLSDGQVIKI
jgi:photosystem II stability/assembly factor-like uncharacterized protein